MAKGKDADGLIKLPETFDLEAMESLHSELLEKRGSKLALDASGVSSIGAQGIQLLISAAQTWRADEKPFAVHGAGEEFVSAVSILGVDADVLCLDGEEHE